MRCSYCQDKHRGMNTPVRALIEGNIRTIWACPPCVDFLAEHTARGESAPAPLPVVKDGRKKARSH